MNQELTGLIEYVQNVGDSESESRCVMDRKTHRKFFQRIKSCRKIQKDAEESNPSLSGFMGKCPGHLGALTLIQHWVACYYGEEHPGKITSISFNRACHLLDYYIGQFRLLQIQIAGPDDLSKAQLYVFNRLKKASKPITLTQIYMGFRNNKNLANQSTKQVKSMFDFFHQKGYGNYDKEKGTLSLP